MGVIYLDNAASTRPDPRVLAAMTEVAETCYANPAAVHGAGAATARRLEAARAELAEALGAQAAEVLFTSGGTEANALAILGVAPSAVRRRRHVVMSAIEHPSVKGNVERLAELSGATVSVVDVGPGGAVKPEDVVAALRPETALVCVMHVNNELGTIQPVADVARALQAHALRLGTRRPHLHVDGVQALGRVRLRVGSLGADSLSVSGHKIHGPKGSGALWVRPGSAVAPLWDGGGQERGWRSGTENLPAAVGLALAARLAAEALASGETERMAALRDAFEREVAAAIPALRPTLGDAPGPRAPHILSLSFPGQRAEPLLHALEARGVIVSAGSACASRLRAPSHVLKAIGVRDDCAVLRLSLSRETTAAEMSATGAALAAALAELDDTRRFRRR